MIALKLVIHGNTQLFFDELCEKIYLSLGRHPSKEGYLIQVSARLSEKTKTWPDLELTGNERILISFVDSPLHITERDVCENTDLLFEGHQENSLAIDQTVSGQKVLGISDLKICFQEEDVVEAQGISEYFVSMLLTGTESARDCSISVCDPESLESESGFSFVWRRRVDMNEEITVSSAFG